MEPEPKSISVPRAGRVYLDIGRDASYEAARRGDIPVIRIGRLLRVPVVAMERMLERAGQADRGPNAKACSEEEIDDWPAEQAAKREMVA